MDEVQDFQEELLAEDFFGIDEDSITLEESMEPIDLGSGLGNDLETIEFSNNLESEKESQVIENTVNSPNLEIEKNEVSSQVVDRYSLAELEYPCLVLTTTDFAKHKIKALSEMIKSAIDFKGETMKVYINSGQNELLSLGGVSGKQVRYVIDLLGRDNITAWYNEETLLEGDLIYTLC